MNILLARGLAGAAAVAAALALATPPAMAHNGDDKVRRGSCSGSTDWRLKVKPGNGRLEVEAEVDSNRAGQTWRWRLSHNGSLSASGVRATRGSSGSFEIRRTTVDWRGTDTLSFRARNARSGELCVGTVNY